MSYNLTKVVYLYFYCYKIFAIKTTWKWISIHQKIYVVLLLAVFKLFWFVWQTHNWLSPKLIRENSNTDYIKSGQGLRLMVAANFPGTGVICKPWTLPETCIVVFPGINSILFLLLLNIKLFIDLWKYHRLFSIYNELLLILPPSHFLLKTAFGKLFSVTLAL